MAESFFGKDNDLPSTCLKETFKSTAQRTNRSEAAIVGEALASSLATESVSTVVPNSLGVVIEGSYGAPEDEAFLGDRWNHGPDGLRTMELLSI